MSYLNTAFKKLLLAIALLICVAVAVGTPSAPQPGPTSTYSQVVRVTYQTNFYNLTNWTALTVTNFVIVRQTNYVNLTNVWTPPAYIPSLVVTGTLFATRIVTSKIVTNTP